MKLCYKITKISHYGKQSADLIKASTISCEKDEKSLQRCTFLTNPLFLMALARTTGDIWMGQNSQNWLNSILKYTHVLISCTG